MISSDLSSFLKRHTEKQIKEKAYASPFLSLKKPYMIALIPSVLLVSGLSLYLWSVFPRPLVILSISIRLAACLLVVTAFFYWKEWRALPLALLFFLMTTRLTLSFFIAAERIARTPLTTTIHETLGLVITLLAFLATVYLWNLFSSRAQAKEARAMAKEAKAKLLRSEQDLRTMVDYSYDWEIWYDVDGRCKYMSPSCERITGYMREEFKASPDLFSTIIHPDDHERVLAHHQTACDQSREKSEIEFRIITKTGETRWIWHQCQAVLGAAGEWLGRRATNRDTTTRHVIETTLQQERAMFMNGPVVIFSWRNLPNWPVEYVSENVAEILGYTGQEFRDGSVLYASLIHPDDLQRVIREVAANSLPDSHHFSHEPYRLLTRDGRIVWVLDTTTMVRDEEGLISHYQGYIIDITRTIQIEEEVLAAKNRLEFIIDGAHLGTWDWNVQTGSVVYNERWAEMLGYTLAEIEPNVSTWEKIIHPDESDTIIQAVTDHLEGRSPIYASEHRLRHKSGQWVWVMDTGKVIQWDVAGKPLRALGIHFDISKQKENEQRALEALHLQEQLKRIESLKTMAGAVAHRFNNSMTAVLGALEYLNRRLPARLSADADEVEMVQMALQAGKEASTVGSSMITYLGHGMPQLQPEDLVEIARKALYAVKGKFPASINVRLIEPATPIICKFDTVQIKQVLENILSNSFESLTLSTRPQAEPVNGRIEISFGIEPYRSETIPLYFRGDIAEQCSYGFCQVTDNGCGMTDADIERIFEPFFTTKFIGRGLGLALAAGIIRAHNGAIVVQSSLGEGTTVRVVLPIA